MEKNDILRETTGREWGKIYLAGAIADAIQNPVHVNILIFCVIGFTGVGLDP